MSVNGVGISIDAKGRSKLTGISHVGSHHANIWKLIEVIKNDDDVSYVDLVQILQGNPPKNSNPVYARMNARILTVVASYAKRQPMDYLQGIAHNIKL